MASLENALHGEYVIIVGAPLECSYGDRKRLRRSGCKVRRIGGGTLEETGQKLNQLAASGADFGGGLDAWRQLIE